MLGGFEAKLAALIAEKLRSRPHVQVFESPGPAAALNAASGRVVVSIREVIPRPSFEVPSVARRTMPVSFQARVYFRHAPADLTDASLSTARQLMTMDLSLTIFHLNAAEVVTGKALAAAGDDAGYQIHRFILDRVTFSPELQDGVLTATATYKGDAEIWPPGPATA